MPHPAERRRRFAGADGLHGALRLLIAAAVGYVLALGAFVAVFIGAVEISGCFISCDAPRPILGSLALLAGSAPAGWAINVVVWAMSPAHARQVGLLRSARAASLPTLALLAWLHLDAGGAGWSVLAAALLVAVTVVWHRDHRAVLRTWEAAIGGIPEVIRTVLAGLVVVATLLTVVAVAFIGRCNFAAGRCPSPQVLALWEQDAVRLAGGWTLVGGTVLVLLTRRTRHWRAWAAVAGAALVAVLVVAAS